jgi:undecaprenyl-diphosphatase
MPVITYFQAIILAVVQGVTELFPVSSLGHSVLLAYVFGWHNLLKQETSDAAGLLTILVVMHVATAIALLVFYRAEWVRIIRGFFRSLQTRKLGGDNDAKRPSRPVWSALSSSIACAASSPNRFRP